MTISPSNDAGMTETLNELIATWRALDREWTDKGLRVAGSKKAHEIAGACDALAKCANDLESALAGIARQEIPSAEEMWRRTTRPLAAPLSQEREK